MFRLIIFIFLLPISLFCQFTSKTFSSSKENSLMYLAYITEEESANLLENFQNNKKLENMGFTMESNASCYEIYKDGELYATLSVYPRSRRAVEGSEIGIPTFELKCKEKDSSLFGVTVKFGGLLDHWKFRTKTEKD